jgi:hypothetical protein
MFGDYAGMILVSNFQSFSQLTHLYANGAGGLVALPGFSYLLDVVLRIVSLAGLPLRNTASGVALGLSGALLVGVALLTVPAALCALDALCETLGVPVSRRRVLCILEMFPLIGVAGLFGHPEDVLTVAFLAGALRLVLTGQRDRAAVWLGAAIAVQTFAVLLVPLLLAGVPLRRWGGTLLRIALLPILVVLLPLIGDFRDTVHQVIAQPVSPRGPFNHPTSWLSLAATLRRWEWWNHEVRTLVFNSAAVPSGARFRVGAVLASGLLAGWMARRMRYGLDPALFVWVTGCAFATRCLFESVIIPYYLLPAIALGLVAAADRGWGRLAACTVFGTATAILAFVHFSPGTYLAVITGGLIAVLACAWPGRTPLPPAAQ